MPKMKTHSGAKKRFRITGSGEIKRSHAFTSHQMRAKTKKQKRNLRKSAILFKGDVPKVRKMLCI